MDDAPPLTRATDTAEKQPQSNPLPTDAELPKGELVKQPPANPTTQEAQPNATSQAQPNTSAQPTTTQQPVQQLPQLPKGVPEIIAGAGGAAIGKTAADLMRKRRHLKRNRLHRLCFLMRRNKGRDFII